jgi:acyl-CoA thioester hydrolase|tara:strand:+ start:6986 stop:7492 length:507 start_codon:yes stop_codon:yes gene_type:complete
MTMHMYNKKPVSSAIIRFQDCDPFGHLNNSKYLDYMINAREDHLIREYDLDIFRMARTEGKSWVVGHSEIVYMKPALVMESVKIQSQLIDFSEKHVQAEMIMYNKTMDQVKAVLWSKFVHYDLKALRSGIHTPELMGLLEQLHEPLEEQRLEVRAKKLAGVQMSPAIN